MEHSCQRVGALVRAIAFAGLLVIVGCSGDDDASRRFSYPSRPIKLIVPFGAGGGTDTFARILARAIKEEELLPQPLVIVNVGGAGATIGSRRVKNARPDGYSLLILHDAILTAQAAGKVSYGPEDFEPIAGTGNVGMVVVVRDDSEYESLSDLMTASREEPDTIPFGVNLHALTHYAGLMLERKSPGSRFRYVHLGGGADRFAKLMGEHIVATGFSLEEFERFRSKGLRALAVLSDERHVLSGSNPADDSAKPQAVLTAREQGFDVVMTNTFYWWAPKGTPDDRVALLAEALKRAMASEGVQRWARENQCNPIFVEGEAMRDRVDVSRRRYATVSTRNRLEPPNYPAVILAGMMLCAMFVARVRRAPLAAGIIDSTPNVATPPPRIQTTAICATITLLYFVSLSVLGIDFRLATFVFVLAIGGLLAERQPRAVAYLFVVAVLMSFGLEFLLSSVFDVQFS